ncbi:sugar transferase [Silicimonas algicola]|uniref:Lipopolysaccharide/colanic/teichoic acid biosynthesis glycosyltransferase n=1 Tax=Silicimonas algicola TaxID=1826607 RepID=A0A316G5A6_9RHOB|nr:sugar transferase [Silicimonas algicola]AZQ68807.1 sugar transferase [Silicimonas algicola]PWK56109.1 lipopolysaccharide/colanic/teichoic acid biosynthesis glycosyltransferase [Silicimonas algicola]
MPVRINLDQVVAALLLPVVLVVLAVLFVVVVPLQGRPFIFASERMKSRDAAFTLFKVRTMHPPDPAAELGALGGHQMARITPLGLWLRRLRLDELPQIFNVLRGDMRFIGPRPPARRYVDAYPSLYAAILADTPPGITGLATVMLHAREERLLSACRSAAETEAVYRRRCIPVKARLDLLYRDRRGPWLNLVILWRTFSRLIPIRLSERRLRAVKASRGAEVTPGVTRLEPAR